MTDPPPRVETRASAGLPSLADAAPWLARFRPPFTFGSFFSPEDTVLCALATRAAIRRAARQAAASGDAPVRRVVELTSGSTLVLSAQLLADPSLQGFGAEVDPEAVVRAEHNLHGLGIADRAHVRRVGLFSPRLAAWLRRLRPAVVTCNPPYIPEPPDAPLALVAGAGPRGDRHPRRVLRVAAAAGAPRVVLSWCSLGDPVAVVRTAVRAGYQLERLWAAVLADGEYSGEVHDYLRTLPTAFLSEDPATLGALAGDGAARFAYLLLAGSFVRAGPGAAADDAAARGRRTVRRIARLMGEFRASGIAAVERAHAARAPGLTLFVVDRWDELRLRVTAHGR